MITATLSSYGANAEVIWAWAAGVLVVLFTIALIIMGVTLIVNLISK